MAATIYTGSMLARDPEVLEARIGDSCVLFHPGAGIYCDLDGSGTYIWNLLAEPRLFDDLLGSLADHYAVDARTCAQDTLGFLNALVEKNFLAVQS